MTAAYDANLYVYITVVEDMFKLPSAIIEYVKLLVKLLYKSHMLTFFDWSMLLCDLKFSSSLSSVNGNYVGLSTKLNTVALSVFVQVFSRI